MKRPVELILLDSGDSLRPPGFDVMMIIIASLGAVLATIQPISQPHVAARIILDPTLFATTLFLALRGSAGVAGLVQRGIMDVYLSYPLSRAQVFLSLSVSRVLLPALTLLSAPLIVAGVILLPVIASDPLAYLMVLGGYLLQAYMYGLVFMLAGIATRNTGTASIVSITFYFTYNIVMILLSTVGTALEKTVLVKLSDSMAFYYLVYRHLLGVGVDTLQLLFVPTLTLAILLLGLLYFVRRFEP